MARSVRPSVRPSAAVHAVDTEAIASKQGGGGGDERRKEGRKEGKKEGCNVHLSLKASWLAGCSYLVHGVACVAAQHFASS